MTTNKNDQPKTTHELAREMLGSIDATRVELGLPDPREADRQAAQPVREADALINRLRKAPK